MCAVSLIMHMPPNYLSLNVVGLWKFPFVPLSLTGHVPVREHFCVFVDMLGFFERVCVGALILCECFPFFFKKNLYFCESSSSCVFMHM